MASLRKDRKIAVRAAAVLAAAVLACVLSFRTGLTAGSREGFAALFSHSGLIRRGDTGELVRSLQEALSACGFAVSADGSFGPKTESAVKRFQEENGLYADGIAGPLTLGHLSKKYYRANPPDTHTVKRGESLSVISEMYGVSIDTLLRLNKLSDPDMIYAGQTLAIKASSQVEPPSPPDTEPPDLPQPEPFPLPNKRICLTFDDGPDPTTTGPILAILRQYGVRATFFLTGEKALQYPELAKEIALDGHVIGVHGFEHKVLSGLPATEVRKDLRQARDAIYEVTGVTARLYRPPFGALDQTQVTEAAKLGMRVVMWTNIGGADLGAPSAQDVTHRAVTAATDGGILMLHEGLQHTVEALPSLIESLARMGYGFQNPIE